MRCKCMYLLRSEVFSLWACLSSCSNFRCCNWEVSSWEKKRKGRWKRVSLKYHLNCICTYLWFFYSLLISRQLEMHKRRESQPTLSFMSSSLLTCCIKLDSTSLIFLRISSCSSLYAGHYIMTSSWLHLYVTYLFSLMPRPHPSWGGKGSGYKYDILLDPPRA